MDSVVIKAKASGPAAMATMATALQLLQSATSVPGFPPAIAPVCAIALQVIQKTQETQENREACHELAEKISQIMVTLLTSYTKQKDPAIQSDMPQNIRQLHRNLVEISRKLRKVLGKSGVEKWFLSSHYKKEIDSCSKKLEWAVNFFKFETLIRIENLMYMLVHPELFNARTHLLASVQMLQPSNSSGVLETGVTGQPVGLPPKPEIFYGREKVVEKVVVRLVSTPNGRFSIGGSGGLGKTSVALTAAHDPRVVAKFGSCRYWIPCDEATSASSLIRLLAQGVKISTSSANLLEQVGAQLSRDDAPKLVILDNFETPWDVLEEHSDVEIILARLVAVPSVTLLLTVRSEQPPCDSITWTPPVLKPLDTLTPNAARQLYIQKHPDAAKDATLDTLLFELSYMPLAIRLVASRGASGEPPHKLLAAWRKYGTATFDRDRTRLGSIQASIRLSTESRTMKDNPDALRLLSLLTLLPAGAPKDFLDDMAPDMDANRAFHVLQSVSLAYLNLQSESVCLLSPIQQFIAESHAPTEQQRDTVFKVFRDLLTAAGDKIGSEKSYVPIRQALVNHFPNVEAILLRRLKEPNPRDAVDLATQICEWNDGPGHLHLARAAQAATGRLHDPFWSAKSNYALGLVLCLINESEAISVLKDALVAFQELKCQRYILWCLIWIAQCLYMDNSEDAISYAEQVAVLARSPEDDEQYAESLRILAQIAEDGDRLADALSKMEQADELWRRTVHLKGSPSAINSLLVHAKLLRRCKRFKEAQEKLYEAAVRIPETMMPSYYEAWRQSELGDVYRDQERITEALEAYIKSTIGYRNGGYIDYALWRQTDVGDMLIRQAHQSHEDCAEVEPVFEYTLAGAQAAGAQATGAQAAEFQEIVDYCFGVLNIISDCLECRADKRDGKPE